MKLGTHLTPSFDPISKFDSAKHNSFSNITDLQQVTLLQVQSISAHQARANLLRVLLIKVQAGTSGGNLQLLVVIFQVMVVISRMARGISRELGALVNFAFWRAIPTQATGSINSTPHRTRNILSLVAQD